MILEHKFSKASDIYSFGVFVWELFSEQKPWTSLTVEEYVIGKVFYESLKMPLNCPKSLWEIVENCFLCAKFRPTFEILVEQLKQMVDNI